MSKPETLKIKATKLTVVNGRVYAAGETIEFTGPEVEYARAHYKVKAARPSKEVQEAATREAAVRKQATGAGAEAPTTPEE